MATLSKDGDSSWKAHGIKVRDAKHVHNGPEVTTAAPAKSKNVKRWCRGKVGVEHKLAVMNKFALGKRPFDFAKDWLIQYCTVCGKELAWFYPMGGMKRDPPEWVKEYRASLSRKSA